MVSDYKDNVLNIINNQIDEDPKSLIDTLKEQNIKLLKENKSLLLLIAEKEKQICQMSENYQKKWEIVCNSIKSVEEICHDLNLNDIKLTDLREDNRVNLDSNMDSSFSNSSFFTVTEPEDYNFTTSSESLVAATNGTIKNMNSKDAYFSLNSLSNYNDEDKSDDGSNEHLYPSYHTINRPQSHCLQNDNKPSNNNTCIDSAISEPHFRIPEVQSPKLNNKKLIKKSSTVKSDRPLLKNEKNTMLYKSFSEFTDVDIVNWLIHVARLPKIFIEDLKLKQKLQGICFETVTEQKLCRILGTSDKLIRKKVMLALEETRSSHNRENIPDGDLSRKDHLWVANIWLKKHLGLGHLSQSFLSRSIDGRLLKFIALSPRQKEFINMLATNYDHMCGLSISPLNFINKHTQEPSKSDYRSIKYGLELLMKFDFDLDELDKRRVVSDNVNLDVLVWTNERVARWFHKLNMKNYIRGIEYSGIHGGIMVLDPQFSMDTMSKLLQIPMEVVKKNNLDDKFSALLKPSRFNEGVKTRRSTSIFRRRSLSQPRHSKANKKHSPDNKLSAANTDISDSASINESYPKSRTVYREKSQTLDLSTSTNQNFIRKYRKPNEEMNNRHKADQYDSPKIGGQSNLLKTATTKLSANSAQISRKSTTTTTKLGSESENSDEL